MRVSVALATYNGEKYLLEQLDSIREQTVRVDEVIISDDHSDDKTVQIINDYLQKYSLDGEWKLLYNPRRGLRENFYNAIKNTDGDIVVLCDQDDVWHLDKIERIKNVFRENEKIKCLNTSFEYINSNGELIHTKQENGKANNNLILHPIEYDAVVQIPLCLVINKNISPGMTMAISREVINLYLEHSLRKALHDWEINCISAAINGLYFYNCSLSQYRIHDEQAVSIGYMRKNTIRDKLKKKIEDSESHVNSMMSMIFELLELSDVGENEKYLSELYFLQTLRRKVICERKILLWPKEVLCFNSILKKYGHIDLRYCIIDLLAAIVK